MDSEPVFLRRGRAEVKKPGRLRRPLSLLAIVLCVAFAGSKFLGGPLFSLRRFEVFGNERSRTEDVLKALDPWRSKNLVTLDLAPLAERLAREPWVERVTLSKKFPDGLAIRVAERRPVALLREKNRLFWVDARGQAIAAYDARADRGEYVLISGERRQLPELVGMLEELREKRPEYFSALSQIDALPDGGFGMMDSIFRRPVRVLRRDAPEKIRALLNARELIVRRGWEARAIDLRFSDRIVLEGAYGAGNSL
ncbi:MAG: FtsQ-type POTRA domain-containing protein [Acidobacteriota bacterium]|nr:FtsQ-type POTRA domain-containing protein [Acidobacteriota bacterium]